MVLPGLGADGAGDAAALPADVLVSDGGWGPAAGGAAVAEAGVAVSCGGCVSGCDVPSEMVLMSVPAPESVDAASESDSAESCGADLLPASNWILLEGVGRTVSWARRTLAQSGTLLI